MVRDQQPPTKLLRVSPSDYATFGVEAPLLNRRGARDWHGISGYTVLAAIKTGTQKRVADLDILLHGTEASQLSMATPNRPGYLVRDMYPSVIAVIGTSALGKLTELSETETDDDYLDSLSHLPPLGDHYAEPGDAFQRGDEYELRFGTEGTLVTIINTSQRNLQIMTAPDAVIDRTA